MACTHWQSRIVAVILFLGAATFCSRAIAGVAQDFGLPRHFAGGPDSSPLPSGLANRAQGLKIGKPGWAEQSSVLRSAYLQREANRSNTARRETAAEARERLQAHFAQVDAILVESTEASLAVALERLRAAGGSHWTKAEEARTVDALRRNRAAQIERLRDYARRGLLPVNEILAEPVPIFVDRHDTACAVGHLMRMSGWSEEVMDIARHDVLVYVPDVKDGPLVQWVLHSGLTQEEAALIQPAYGPPCDEFRAGTLGHDLSNMDFSGQNLSGQILMCYDFSGANLSRTTLRGTYLHSVTNADLTGADIRGVWLSGTAARALTPAQLASTASYQARDLSGIGLSGANMSGWNFSEQNLTNASFHGSMLTGTNFNKANLTNVNLGRADLTNADLAGANVRGAHFGTTVLTPEQLYSTASYRERDMTGIGLSSNNLTGWNFADQKLVDARFGLADLTYADFTGADVRGASFLDANLTSAQLYSTVSYQSRDLSGIQLGAIDLSNGDLAGQNLTNSMLRAATLTNADFTGAKVQGAKFGPTLTSAQLYATASYQARDLSAIELSGDLSGWNLAGQNLARAQLEDAILTGAKLAGADLKDSNLRDSSLTGANLTGADVRGANFSSSNLTAAQLYSTGSYQDRDLAGIDLRGRDMTGWALDGQDLTNADLGSAVLDAADLRGAKLTDVRFSNATFTNADFTGADVRGVSFLYTNLTPAQLYSTASYQARDLSGIELGTIDLSNWDFAGQNLTNSIFRGTILTNADFTGAKVQGARFFGPFTSAQLYATASYQDRDLSGIGLNGDLSGWKFAGQNLTDADFSSAQLTNADFSGALVRGAFFGDNLTPAQLYSTASYQAKDLSGIGFVGNRRGWNFAEQDLTGADLRSDLTNANLAGANLSNAYLGDAELTGADLTGADLRGAILARAAEAVTTNTILPEGYVSRLVVDHGQLMRVRDYDGREAIGWWQALDPLPITVLEEFAVARGGRLRLEVENDPWDSLILFQHGIPVNLGGTLELTFTSDVDAATQVGRTLRIFDWSGVNPAGKFEVRVPPRTLWDASKLYTTGEIAVLPIASDVTVPPGSSYVAGGLRANSLTLAGNGSRLAILPTGGAAEASKLSALNIAEGATLDLTDNQVIIDYAGASPVATVRHQILAGRGGAGLGKAWNGMGITSSAAAAANATDPESRSVGYAENSTMPLGPLTTFRGQTVDNTSILMAFTRTGDANLDGVVNDDDVTIVGAMYAPDVPQPSWALGDFDYNGFVDDDDVTLLGAFYDPSATPIRVPAAGVAAVPEPGRVALLLTSLIGIPLVLVVRRKSR